MQESIINEFKEKYNIVINCFDMKFEERYLQYKYNTLLPEFQDSILQDLKAAILTAQKGYITRKVLRYHLMNLCPDIFTLYKESLRPRVQNQFYFSGRGSGIKVENMNWVFQDGIGFCIWFSVEKINYDQFNENNIGVQKILSIHAQGSENGGGIECFIMRGSVYYRIINKQYKEPEMGQGVMYIGQLKDGQNFLAISHEPKKTFSSSHLTILFNKEQQCKTTFEFPRLNSNLPMTRFSICENLFGTSTCIILMSQSSSKINLIQQVYGQQQQMDYNLLKSLQSTLDKYFDRIMSIYIPEFSSGNRIADLMGNFNAILQSNSGFVIADKNKFNQFGGFKLFYALLHISANYQDQITIMFEVMNIILKNNPSLQDQAYHSKFLPTVASIIMSFEKPLINAKCVELLNEFKLIIIDNRLMQHFFIYILWNSKLHQQCTTENVFKNYLQLSSIIYLQNQFINFISPKDLLDILFYSYNDQSCCNLHHPNPKPSFQLIFFNKILYLFDQQNDLTDKLILFEPYFLSKMSPCLLLQIFTKLKSLLVDNQDNTIKTIHILYVWYQNNIVYQLLFLFKTTYYNDIRAILIYFLNLISQQKFINYQQQTEEAIEFINNFIIQEQIGNDQQFQEHKNQQQFSLAPIYNQLMGWMIDKLKIGANESLMIEEGDQIHYSSIINIIMKILKYSQEENLRAQILQDLLCLCKSHQCNSQQMLSEQQFQSTLLHIIQIQDENNLIYEIGHRLHSTLLMNVLKNEANGAEYFLDLLKFNGQNDKEIQSIYELLYDQCKNYSPSFESQLWKNILMILMYLCDMKERYQEYIIKFNNIINLLYKDFLFKGYFEEQLDQISSFFNGPIKELSYRMFSFLNSNLYNFQVFEILLRISNQENLYQLLLVYSITYEICKSEINYPLKQIMSTTLKKGQKQRIKEVIIQMCLMIMVVNGQHNNTSFLNKFFIELYDDFDQLLKVLQQQSFLNDNLIDELLIKLKLNEDYDDIKLIHPQRWSKESGVSIEIISQDVQLCGEARLIQNQEKRAQWLYIESNKERIGRRKYYKSLQQLFLEGEWLQQKKGFYQKDQIIKDFNQEFEKDENYSVRISKMLTKSLVRPYLKTIAKIPEKFKNKAVVQTPQEAPLLLYTNSKQKSFGNLQAIQAATQLYNISKAIGSNIKNVVKTIATQQPFEQFNVKSFADNHFKGKRIKVINGLFIYHAFLTLTDSHLLVQYEKLFEKVSHVSFCDFQLRDDQLLLKQYPLYNLQQIIKKKYLQKRNALEIFFIDGKSIFFSVPDPNDLDEISIKILSFRKTQNAPFLNQSKTTDPIKLLDKQGYYQKWIKSQMSNFRYLLMINNLASRSYNDITQYPIFPWVLQEDDKAMQQQQQSIQIYPEGRFRAFQKTMGAMGNQQRVLSYIERFEQSEQGSEIPQFHYGSHYSTPAIISQYLVRLEPFTSASKAIQGDRFDIADRLFYYFCESYRCAVEDIADVRELIPEIFCLPEMFLNLANLNFGKTQTGLFVNNVILPKWCNGNPWIFVTGYRNALESEEVSKNLQEWIDLIFGYKQRGKEAEKSLNVFFYLTYDNQLTLEKMEENKLGIESQIVNFGITPLQLFTRQHNEKIFNNEFPNILSSSNLTLFRPSQKKNIQNTLKYIINFQSPNNEAIVKIKLISNARLLCLRKDGKINYFKYASSNDLKYASYNDSNQTEQPFTFAAEKEKLFNFIKPLGESYILSDSFVYLPSYPILILNQGKIFLCGGYYQGKLLAIGENNQISDIYIFHTSTITKLATDKKEFMVITGDKTGHVILWKIDKSTYKLQVEKQYFHHQHQINCIYVSNNMKLFATGCAGGSIYVYNLYNGSLLRSFMHPNNNSINSIIMSSRPLFCIVFFSAQDHKIYSYSINGFLLEVQQENCFTMIDCQIIKNNLHQDIMIYGTENSEIVRRHLPYLQPFQSKIKLNIIPLSIIISKDKRFLFCGCSDGNLTILTESQKNK
ncbi:unnamed protein product [Paramecium sonneborni]|uniref:Beige/BEACH domain protein n=1 Tax=Paramecium sonneborni TaxID=65129 RepID=A0A8S1RH81_9CILI|nr:unnamed protein product [Paramecium sonneborni]